MAVRLLRFLEANSRRIGLLGLPALFWLLLATNVTSARAAIPPDAAQFLKELGGKVTMEVVLLRAIQKSESFKILQTSAIEIDAPYYRGLEPYETRLEAEVSHSRDRNEAETPFNPNRIESSVARLRGSKYFSTGTTLDAELSHGGSDLSFPQSAFPNGELFAGLNYFQTRLGVTLSQNLWQDALGRGGRFASRNAQALQSAARHALRQNTEDWVMGLVQIYYGAWLAQRQVEIAQDNLKRRKRLLNLTQIKLRRGTAETPDLLQVQSALLNTEADLAAARQILGDRWRGLVSMLKLPSGWMNIDPMEIPVALDQPVNEALKSCIDATPLAKSASVERAESLAQAAQWSWQRAQDAARPDLELRATLSANGIDSDSRGATFGETVRFDNPAWTLGLRFTLPLFRYEERAQALSAFAEQMRAEAQRADAVSEQQLQWTNACLDLRRLEESSHLLREAFRKQLRRVEEEENRFRLGRSGTLAVIQAGDDATAAELNHQRAEGDRRLAAWRVRRLAGAIEAEIKKMTENTTPEAAAQ